MSKNIIPDRYEGFPVVTAEEMRSLDRRAQEEYGISSMTLMENAGKGVAGAVLEWIEASGKKPSACGVVICCGRGNNGGDGLVVARHLAGKVREARAFIAAVKEGKSYSPDVRVNLQRARDAKVPVETLDRDMAPLQTALQGAALVVDALLGTGATGKPAGSVHKMIQAITRSGLPVVSVDIPSGLQPDTGHHSGVFIAAALTLTLGVPKRGLLATHAQKNVGTLKILDIGFPKELLQSLGGSRGLSGEGDRSEG